MVRLCCVFVCPVSAMSWGVLKGKRPIKGTHCNSDNVQSL